MPFEKPNKEDILKVDYIELSPDSKNLRIETPRLIIEPVTKNDIDEYCKIFCDEENMKMYQNGDVKTRDWVEKRVNAWADKWERGYPYAGMKVQLKNPDGTAGEIIGHIVSGDGEAVGVSEMAFAFKQYADNGDKIWGNYFGTEAVNAMVNHAIPLLKANGIKVMAGPTEETEELAPLKKVVATARPDNTASGRLLEQFFDGNKTHAKPGTAENQYKDARDIYEHHVPEHDRFQAFISKERFKRASGMRGV